MVKKLALVELANLGYDPTSTLLSAATASPHTAPTIRIQETPVIPIEVKLLYDMDEVMKNILNDKKLPLTEKIRKYNDTLSRFVSLSREIDFPLVPTATTPIVNATNAVQQYLTKLNTTKLRIVNKFLTNFKNSKRLNWNDDGNISIDGVIYRDSNIIKILDYHAGPKKFTTLKPEQYDEVLHIIQPRVMRILKAPTTTAKLFTIGKTEPNDYEDDSDTKSTRSGRKRQRATVRIKKQSGTGMTNWKIY